MTRGVWRRLPPGEVPATGQRARRTVAIVGTYAGVEALEHVIDCQTVHEVSWEVFEPTATERKDMYEQEFLTTDQMLRVRALELAVGRAQINAGAGDLVAEARVLYGFLTNVQQTT